jgi:ABC-type tungstate transport system substrate-binding protein
MPEIIAAMRENPALAEQARSVLLSRDLLELPAVVAALAQAQTRTEQRLEELAQAMAVLAQRVASNTDTIG